MRLLSAFILAGWVLSLFRSIANLLLIHRLRGNTAAAWPPHSTFVSIIIPARNEARAIEQTLRAFLAQDYGAFEVILVDDRSTDGTGDLARALGDPRLVVISGEEPPAGWLGKPWAMQQGSRAARGELLLFVDADVRYEPAALRAAVAHIEREPGIAMLALLPHFEMHGFWENVAMPALAMFAFSVLPSWLSNRTRLAVLGVGAGTGNLVRREAYERCGGHEALKDAVVDDVGLARLLRRNGEVTEAVRADTLVSVRMYHGGSEILRGFTKNAFAVVNRSYLAAVPFLVFNVVIGLLPYFLALTGDRFAIATVVLISVVRVIIFAAFRYPLLYAIFAHPLMAAFWIVIFVRSMWLTGVRRELEWRGRTYDASATRFGPDR
jgi:chlorobactene glucosyltransferase